MRTFNLDIVRAVAILLVTNSHFDQLYPDPRLGTGGALGNALFFALSGYGLTCSARIHLPAFFNWLKHRLLRIYLSVWIVALITLTWLGAWQRLTWESGVAEFLWPTRHWFVSAIVLFYIAFFPFLRSLSGRPFMVGAGLLCIPYLAGYFWFLDLGTWSLEGGYFKWIFYAQVMLLGGWLAHREDLLGGRAQARDAAGLAVLFIGYFAAKLALQASGQWDLQFVVHAITLPLLFYSLRVASSQRAQAWILSSRTGKLATLVAGMAFEIYLTQHLFHQSLGLQSLPFPIGAALALAGTAALAYLVRVVADILRQRLVAERPGLAPAEVKS